MYIRLVTVNIIFHFEPELFSLDIDKLVNKYRDRIKFSSRYKPYITYRLSSSIDVTEEIKEFLNDNNK